MPLLYEQIANRIVRSILNGEFRPGDQLPTEQEYARDMGVSRITVKRAMSTLSREGVIERFRGKGTFVTSDALRNLPSSSQASQIPVTAETGTKRRRIGFLMPEISDLFGVRMTNGIDDRCREQGIDLSIRRTHGDVALEAETIQTWIADGLDGVIVFPCHGEFYNESLLRAVLNGFPIVLVDRTLSGIPVPSVMTDNRRAATAITDWLLDQGHRLIAFISPPVRGTSSLEDRRRGFEEAIHQRLGRVGVGLAHLELQSTLPGADAPEQYDLDRRALGDFLQENAHITAILASEYSLAVLADSVISRDPDLVHRGIEIACFDSFPAFMTLRTYPHIKQDEDEIGRRAVDVIVSQLDGNTPPVRQLIDFNLITPDER